MTKEVQTKKKLDGYLYGFTRQQQEKIKAFADVAEIVEIYKTDTQNVEMRIRIPKRKSLKSIWIKQDGDDYEQNVFGALGSTIEESKLTIEEYKEKFPFENIGFAPLSIPGTSIGNLEIDFPKKSVESDVEIVGRPVEVSPERSEYQFAEVSRIKPSPTNPRRRFDETSLDELAANIEENGLINPITVRRALIAESDRFDFEIVAGERRWRASQRTSHKTIPVIVKELTDEQVLEIQIHENLHREEVHPLDEAFAYEHLMKTLKITQEELALRVGKPEKFVRTRLKLNSLIAEAQEDLEANRITIKMALEIAKFDPAVQPKVLHCAFDSQWKEGKYVPIKESRKTFNDFIDEVSEEVLLELSSAKFDRKDTTLRPDGLACINCPERTGAKNSLFEDYDEEEDRCLNSSCFQSKTKQYLNNYYKTNNQKVIRDNGFAGDYQLKILSYSSYRKEELQEYFEAKVFGDGDYRFVSEYPGKGKKCADAELAIYMDHWSHMYGKIRYCCFNRNCAEHWRAGSSSSSSSSSDDLKEKRERLKRKQELFDVKVGEIVRRRVLKEAAENFAKKQIENKPDSAIKEPFFLEYFARFWFLQTAHNDKTSDFIGKIIKEWTGEDLPYLSRWDFEKCFTDLYDFLGKLTAENLYRIEYLLLHGYKGEMFYGNFKTQEPIEKLAEEQDINYRLIDASVRLTHSPKKAMSVAQVYYNAVERGEVMAKPIFYNLD